MRSLLGGAVVAVALALAWSPRPASAAAEFVIAPYVQDVRSDGFTVVFDTADEVAAEVSAGAAVVATPGRHHEAALHGLVPASLARYRVAIGGVDRGGGEVRLVDPARPLTFVVYGDTRNGPDAAARVAAIAGRLEPDFVLFTGDVALAGNAEDGWRDFFASQAPLLAHVPLYPALGNHEIYRDPDAVRFRSAFVLPDGGRERLYYSFRWGPALFLVLDGNAVTAVQTRWLAGALDAAARDRVPHVFALVHQAPLSVAEHCGAAPEQAEWIALFERHRVRAVFAGHDHAYERMERNGVRYFVSGGAGAPLYGERPSCAAHDQAARRVFHAQHHLLRVRVDAGSVAVTALPLDDGPLLDEVRFAGGEPMFAANAPPLGPTPPAGASHRPWLLAGGGAIVFLLLGAAIRRRRR
jgi:hypothetical protein